MKYSKILNQWFEDTKDNSYSEELKSIAKSIILEPRLEILSDLYTNSQARNKSRFNLLLFVSRLTGINLSNHLVNNKDLKIVFHQLCGDHLAFTQNTNFYLNKDGYLDFYITLSETEKTRAKTILYQYKFLSEPKAVIKTETQAKPQTKIKVEKPKIEGTPPIIPESKLELTAKSIHSKKKKAANTSTSDTLFGIPNNAIVDIKNLPKLLKPIDLGPLVSIPLKEEIDQVLKLPQKFAQELETDPHVTFLRILRIDNFRRKTTIIHESCIRSCYADQEFKLFLARNFKPDRRPRFDRLLYNIYNHQIPIDPKDNQSIIFATYIHAAQKSSYYFSAFSTIFTVIQRTLVNKDIDIKFSADHYLTKYSEQYYQSELSFNLDWNKKKYTLEKIKDAISYRLYQHLVKENILSKKEFDFMILFTLLHVRYEMDGKVGKIKLVITHDSRFFLDFMIDQVYFEAKIDSLRLDRNQLRKKDENLPKIQNLYQFNSGFDSCIKDEPVISLAFTNSPLSLRKNLLRYFITLTAIQGNTNLISISKIQGNGELIFLSCGLPRDEKLIFNKEDNNYMRPRNNNISPRNDFIFAHGINYLIYLLFESNNTKAIEELKTDGSFLPTYKIMNSNIAKINKDGSIAQNQSNANTK